jgi:predicted nucleotidyltransferase
MRVPARSLSPAPGLVASWPEFSPSALLGALVGRGVDFVVIGGFALIAQGGSRLTRDLDVCFAGDDANLQALGDALLAMHARLRGVTDEVPFVPDAATLRHVHVLTLDTDHGPLDLLVEPAGAPRYETLRRNADALDLGGLRVLVASLEDLMTMKRATGRDKDRLDLAELEVIARLRRQTQRASA